MELFHKRQRTILKLAMRLVIKTKVRAPLTTVKAGFTSELFLKLNPPFPKVRLLQFDGCKAGDRVLIQLDFLLFKQYWISDIVEDGQTAKEWFFVDKGTKLPFFLKTWLHRHRIVVLPSGESQIIDDFAYTTGTWVTDLLMYPLLYVQFVYRRPIYRKHFME